MVKLLYMYSIYLYIYMTYDMIHELSLNIWAIHQFCCLANHPGEQSFEGWRCPNVIQDTIHDSPVRSKSDQVLDLKKTVARKVNWKMVPSKARLWLVLVSLNFSDHGSQRESFHECLLQVSPTTFTVQSSVLVCTLCRGLVTSSPTR